MKIIKSLVGIASACIFCIPVMAQSSVVVQFYRQMTDGLNAGDYEAVRVAAENLSVLDTPRRQQHEAIAAAIAAGDTDVVALVGELVDSLDTTAIPDLPSASLPTIDPAATPEPAVVAEPRAVNPQINRIMFGRSGRSYILGRTNVTIEGQSQYGQANRISLLASLNTENGCPSMAKVTFRAYDRSDIVATWDEYNFSMNGRSWAINTLIPDERQPDYVDVSDAVCF